MHAPYPVPTPAGPRRATVLTAPTYHRALKAQPVLSACHHPLAQGQLLPEAAFIWGVWLGMKRLGERISR